MCRQIECGLGSSPASFFVTTTGLKMLWLLCKYLSFVRKIQTASFQDVFGFTSWAHTYLFSEVFGISIHSINLPLQLGYVELGPSRICISNVVYPQGALYYMMRYNRPRRQFFIFSLSPRHIDTALAPNHYNSTTRSTYHCNRVMWNRVPHFFTAISFSRICSSNAMHVTETNKQTQQSNTQCCWKS